MYNQQCWAGFPPRDFKSHYGADSLMSCPEAMPASHLPLRSWLQGTGMTQVGELNQNHWDVNTTKVCQLIILENF